MKKTKKSKRSKQEAITQWLCQHGPEGRCVNCMKSPGKGDAAPTQTKPCSHPENMTCPECVVKGKNDAFAGLGGGQTVSGRASRLAAPPVASSSSSSSAAAAPGMSTGRTLGGRVVQVAATELRSTQPRPGCLHGSNTMCPNCAPEEAKVSLREAATTRRRCRHHGPNGSCVECMGYYDSLKMVLKAQADAHTVRVSVAPAAATAFQRHVQETGAHRVAWLFGRHLGDGSTRVDVLYEPPQPAASPKGYDAAADDPHLATADGLAAQLGLERVGWCFSRKAHKSYALSGEDVTRAAALQHQFGERFVTLALLVKEKKGTMQFEAFQVSDQAVELASQGAFEGGGRKADTVALGTPVIVEAAEVREAATAFFTVATAVTSHESRLGAAGFPPSHRAAEPVSRETLRRYVLQATGEPAVRQFADFHLLLYLVAGLGWALAEMPSICGPVALYIAGAPAAETPAIPEGYLLMLNGVAGI